jgi:UDP-2,4-diacetamido-2,4,6-trideoxy-beta-L-altropyranose hydrolase
MIWSRTRNLNLCTQSGKRISPVPVGGSSELDSVTLDRPGIAGSHTPMPTVRSSQELFIVTALVVFLCAGTPATGAGHLSRCLALAGAYRKAGWRTEFIVTGDAFARFFGADYSWRVAASPEQILAALKVVARNGCELVVIDDYALDGEFESDCRNFARRIVVLDDQTGRHHRCDVVVDAAVSDASVYRDLIAGTARVLAGPKYALIRSDILRHRRTAIEARAGRNPTNILLSFGATDPAGLTLTTLDAIADQLPDGITLTIALSSRAPGIEAIRSRGSSRIHLAVDADMGEVIAAADLAVGAAGVGAFERAALGLPGIVVAAADNQKGIARLLVEAGASLDGGEPDAEFSARIVPQLAKLVGDADLRASMASAAAALADGRAADRIRLACTDGRTTSAGVEVRLRAAEFEDADWLLELQREPATRRFARNPAPPALQQHMRWLAGIFEKGSCCLVIVEAGGAPAGMIRLDPSERCMMQSPQYEVSIAVSTAFHGKGVGSASLWLIRELNPSAIFDAFVLPENETSLRMFLRAGYIDAGGGFYSSVPRERPVAEE